MWFRIPEYQRPYVWGADEIGELLDDLAYAMNEKILNLLLYKNRAGSEEILNLAPKANYDLQSGFLKQLT